MKKILFILICLIFATLVFFEVRNADKKECLGFDHSIDAAEFYDACLQLPSTKEGFYKLHRQSCFSNVGVDDFPKLQNLTRTIFLDTIESFIEVVRKKIDASKWLYNKQPEWSSDMRFQRLVRKLVLPLGSQIEFRGDLHGDVHSLVLWLKTLVKDGWLDKDNQYKIVGENRYLAFLGDYVDRGIYGVEVMYIIMQLYLHNPDKVILVRGNHEDFNQILNDGFFAEMVNKFAFNSDVFRKILASSIGEIYDTLPVAVFLGCESQDTARSDFVLCSHGGMGTDHERDSLIGSEGSDVYELLIDSDLKRLSHYQWNDFDFKNEKPDGGVSVARGFFEQLHQYKTTELLKKSDGGNGRVMAIFRAHQHDLETIPHILKYGNGIYRLWSKNSAQADWGKGRTNIQWNGSDSGFVEIGERSVWTFNVAPRTGYFENTVTGLDYDTVARVTLNSKFENWAMQPRKIPAIS